MARCAAALQECQPPRKRRREFFGGRKALPPISAHAAENFFVNGFFENIEAMLCKKESVASFRA